MNNRREFLGALAGGALAAKDALSQEAQKTPEQRVVALESKMGTLTNTWERIKEIVKKSGITQKYVEGLLQQTDAVFLRDLQDDFEILRQVDRTHDQLQKAKTSLASKQPLPAGASKEAQQARQFYLETLESEINDEERMIGEYVKVLNLRWDINAIQTSLASKSKIVSLEGLGDRTPKVQKELEGTPRGLLTTIDSIKIGEQTRFVGEMGNYYGHQSVGSTERNTLILDQNFIDAQDFSDRFKYQLAATFNWDEIDELSPQDRLEWIEEARQLQAKSNIKDSVYENKVQADFGQRVKNGTMTEQLAKTILSGAVLRRFSRNVCHKFMVDQNFSQQNPEEFAFAKKWMDRIKNSKGKVEFKTK